MHDPAKLLPESVLSVHERLPGVLVNVMEAGVPPALVTSLLTVTSPSPAVAVGTAGVPGKARGAAPPGVSVREMVPLSPPEFRALMLKV